MASEPAPQDELSVAARAAFILAANARGRYENGVDLPVDKVSFETEARVDVGELQRAGLLADPAQAAALLTRLAELTEQAGKQRSTEWLRLCATLPMEEWPPAPAYKGPMVPAAEHEKLAADHLALLGQRDEWWEHVGRERRELEGQRDRLSLMLRAMARKLVAYRKWTLGDDVPEVHRLRREVARLTDLCREMEARANRISRCSCDNDGIECTHEAERDERQARLEEHEELLAAIWLYVKWRYVTKQLTTEQKNLWADAVEKVSERHHPGEGAKADRWWQDDQPVRAALAGDQPTTELDKTWCPRCCKDATEDRYTQESSTLWRCLDCHAVLQVADPPLPGVALRDVGVGDDTSEPAVTPPDPSGRILDGGPVQPFTAADHEETP